MSFPLTLFLNGERNGGGGFKGNKSEVKNMNVQKKKVHEIINKKF